MKQRKYLPTLAELLDRLTITQMKEWKIPEHRQEYTQEINDIMNDIEICLEEEPLQVSAGLLRDLVILCHMNSHIWFNESNFRKGIRDGNDLELTHGLNGIRNTAKNRIQSAIGGRKDYKIDNVEAFKQWVPSGYGEE